MEVGQYRWDIVSDFSLKCLDRVKVEEVRFY